MGPHRSPEQRWAFKRYCAIWSLGRITKNKRDRGEMAIVLVEQYLDFAAELADDFIILERGRVVASGAGHELKTSEQARELLAI